MTDESRRHDFDSHVATTRIIALENKVKILEARIHRLDWARVWRALFSLVAGAIGGVGASKLL